MSTIDWEAVARAELHPLRVRILETMAGGETTPKDLATRLGEQLGIVSYHVRQLAALQLVREVRTEPRRGALAHFYVLGDRAMPAPVMVARRGGQPCSECGAKLRDTSEDGLCGFCQAERAEVAA